MAILEFNIMWRSLARCMLCLFVSYYYLFGTRSTAPLLLLPSVQPAPAPATPEGPTDAQVVQLRRFHLHHVCQYIAVLSIFGHSPGMHPSYAWAHLSVSTACGSASKGSRLDIQYVDLTASYILDCSGGKVTSELTTRQGKAGRSHQSPES